MRRSKLPFKSLFVKCLSQISVNPFLTIKSFLLLQYQKLVAFSIFQNLFTFCYRLLFTTLITPRKKTLKKTVQKAIMLLWSVLLNTVSTSILMKLNPKLRIKWQKSTTVIVTAHHGRLLNNTMGQSLNEKLIEYLSFCHRSNTSSHRGKTRFCENNSSAAACQSQ